jgi:acyl-CoA thioesterase-1
MEFLTQGWRREYWLSTLVACAAAVVIATTSPAHAKDSRPVVLFLGTSLTAGYGLPSDEAFPALIQNKVDAAGLDYRVVNAGVSGDTSAGGLGRTNWLLQSPVAVLVLELGANDMLRGLDPVAMRRNLFEIVDRTKAAYPAVKLVVAGMRAAPNLGSKYREQFESVYPELARAHNAPLIPFLLVDVAANPRLNQVDGIHPTAEGHTLIAKRVWGILEAVLKDVEVAK